MKLIWSIVLMSFVMLACNSRQDDQTYGSGTELRNDGDTTDIIGELNSRGNPREGLPQHGASDTLGTNRVLDENNVPPLIIEKIENDDSLNNRQITSVREFTRNDTTFYEFKLDDESSGKIVYDQYGSKREAF
ncbi:MAG: hypothetical protein WD398_10175 [Cyclobacteriaceae bacterium]